MAKTTRLSISKHYIIYGIYILLCRGIQAWSTELDSQSSGEDLRRVRIPPPATFLYWTRSKGVPPSEQAQLTFNYKSFRYSTASFWLNFLIFFPDSIPSSIIRYLLILSKNTVFRRSSRTNSWTFL